MMVFLIKFNFSKIFFRTNLFCNISYVQWFKFQKHSFNCLIGSRIIESTANCYQIFLIPTYKSTVLIKPWLIGTIGYFYHFYVGPKLIILSGGYCNETISINVSGRKINYVNSLFIHF